MTPIRKILVPTDFSPLAAEAFRQAVLIARQIGAVVVVLHVARPPALIVDGGRLSTNPTDPASADLWDAVRGLQAENPGVAVEYEVIVTDKPEVSHVLSIVEAVGCDLIVMGTRAEPGPRHRWFRSLSRQVLRHARCPVLVVRSDAAEGPPPAEEEGARGADDPSREADAELAAVYPGEFLG
jgi:nucleotide-binding universal stress UspA family protein